MPTPVSALIHAATMVTAGVYLLMRTSPLIEYSSTVLILCLWLGAITTVFSSLIGLFQQDIKKVIAYSTMSQMAQEDINYINIFRHQTICVEVIYIINSQITKAHNYLKNNYISFSFFNSFSSIYMFKLGEYFFKIIPYVKSEKGKVNAICKLVGISEAIRLILIFKLKNSLLIKSFIILLKNYLLIKSFLIFFYLKNSHTSKHIKDDISNPNYLKEVRATTDPKVLLKQVKKRRAANPKDLAFTQWLAGLIDGRAQFKLTKKGYASCEITMDICDKQILFEIKHKYGGSIKPISNVNAVRYKLRHKKGLILLISHINGHLRNPTRLLQINKLCLKYNIDFEYPQRLTYNNGWLSGFIDSDGSVHFNELSGQMSISITQKNKHLLDPLITLYNGRINILSPKIDAFKYIVYRKLDLFNLIDNYFSKYPLKTKKMNRINLIKEFYLLWIPQDNKCINNLYEWFTFKDKWEKYKD